MTVVCLQQLSQFWYNEATVQALVKVVDKLLPDNGKVALISCPTLFVPVKRQLADRANGKFFATIIVKKYKVILNCI